MDIEFNYNWKLKCNSGLILRFWRYKNCPGICTTTIYGINIVHKITAFGELSWINRSFIN